MSPLSRRQVMTAGMAGAAALALGACGGGSDAPKDTVRLYSDNPRWKDGFLQAGETLKKLVGFGFEPLSVATTTEYQQVVRSSLQTPKTADVIKWWSGYRLRDLAKTGALTDLTAQWEAFEQKGWVYPQLKDSYSHKGKVYGLPIYQSYWVVFYNKPVFDQHGLQPPTTWAEFEALAAALKSKGITPLYTSQADGWPSFIPFAELLGKLDPDFYEKLTAGQASYTDPQVRRVLALWKGWIDRGWVTSADLKLDDAPAQLKAGKLAMLPVGTWQGAVLKTAGLAPGEGYDAFLLPTVEPATARSVFVEGGAWAVPASAPNHDAAMKVVGAWLDPSVQRVWTDFLGDGSPNPTVQPADPVLKRVIAQVEAKKTRLLNRYWEASPPPLVEGNVQDLAKFMLDPGQADSVLASMQRRADTEWATWNKDGG